MDAIFWYWWIFRIYLEFIDKTMKINNYLSQERFNKWEIIKVNWVIYINEDLVYYDNRTLKERFPTPTYIREDVRTVKTIVRNDSKRNPWIKNSSPHEPAPGLYSCNSIGDSSPYNFGMIDPPILSYYYLKHYGHKSTEEFEYKIKKGLYVGGKYNIRDRIDFYFQRFKFTKEKLELLEKILNQTFDRLQK